MNGTAINKLKGKKLKGFLDENPRIVVATSNLRFTAYRVLRKIRETEACLSIETEEGQYFETPSFFGEYEVCPDTFEILGQPWRVGTNPLTKDENYILTNKKRTVKLEPGSYRITEL